MEYKTIKSVQLWFVCNIKEIYLPSIWLGSLKYAITYVYVRVDRAAQNACERDSKDKNHSQNLDDRMQQLRNSSGAIGYQPGIENIDNT